MLLPVLTSLVLSPGVQPPASLYTLNHESLKPAEAVLAQTLQGLTARKAPRIWLKTKGVQVQLLNELRKEGTRIQDGKDVWFLLKQFRPEVKGAIVYKLGTPSLSVANGLCGPMNAVAVDESLLDAAKANGLPVLLDARGMTEKDAFAKYRNRYAKGVVVEQRLAKPGHLRDYAVKHNAFVMDTDDRAFRREVVRAFGPHPLVFGWGADEYQWIEDVSAGGGTGVPADWALNLSVLESMPVGPLHPPKPKPIKLESGVRYVAFVMSDGDNIQWMLNDFAVSKNFYGSPRRGEFPMSWEISTLLNRFGPRVMRYIYANAKPTDDFVAGAGLPGYTFPALHDDLPGLARATAPYVRESGLSAVSVLNANSGSLEQTFPWLDLPEVTGVIYKDYAPYHRRRGETAWHNGKPVVAYRFLLWENLAGVDALVSEIGKMPVEGDRFGLVNVHAWSYGGSGGPLEAVKQVVDKLPPNTKVVTANQLLDLMRQSRVPGTSGGQ